MHQLGLSRFAKFSLAAIVAIVLLVNPGRAHAQVLSDTVAEAHRLRTSGSLPAAAALLQVYLTNHPDHGDAARLLAQTLYWQKRPSDARRHYEDALARHPEDSALRLDYGQMLIDMGDGTRAREVLRPLLGVAALNGRAEALLGTLAYWNGDLANARRLLRAAANADSTQTGVRRMLDEITVATSPWLETGGELRRDDQPLHRGAARATIGWYPGPATSLSTWIVSEALSVGDSLSDRVTMLTGRVTHNAPALRLSTEIAGGMLRRSSASSDWVGLLDLGLHLSQRLVLHAAAERAPYLYTAASTSIPVITNTFRASLQWAAPGGWLGEARVQAERYPDDNTVRTAYVWLLAPVVNRSNAVFQVGYSVAAQESDESRFVPNQPSPSPGQGNTPTVTDGHYSPYYTPSALLVHSFIAATSVRLSPTVDIRLNGGYGVIAHEDAPFFTAAVGAIPPTIEPDFMRRKFSPWEMRGAVGMNLSPSLRLIADGQAGASAFYHYTTVGARLSYRFAAAANRRLARH
ncbi:MAG: tetratricopeptide repeat protein [Gemmatimonadales bacterium]